MMTVHTAYALDIDRPGVYTKSSFEGLSFNQLREQNSRERLYETTNGMLYSL